MLYFSRIGIYEGIYINKTSASKDLIFVTIGIFQIKSLSFNRMSGMGLMNLSDIAILNITGADYRCIINEFSKSKPIKLLQKANLNEKMEPHKIQFFFIVCKRWVRKL